MALGRPNVASDVAACYDCHGHHDVFPVSDPRSRLSKERILGTCQQCHPGVGPKFTRIPAPRRPPRRGPLPAPARACYVGMTALLIGVFAFFGLHTLLWLVRSVYLYLNDSKTFREAKVKASGDDEQYTRFTPFERVLHLLVVTSFLLLVLTGMPLKFYYTSWAQGDLQRSSAGPRSPARCTASGPSSPSRTSGCTCASLAGEPVAQRSAPARPGDRAAVSVRRAWGACFGPDSMVPSFQDWRDFVAHQKWFFGKGPRPQFDRWTYWERFDYFAVFWGIFIIGASGLVMWFPEFFTRFLPGLADQHRPAPPLRRGAARRRLHLHLPLLQHPFPHREVPDGHGHLLRPDLEDRADARAEALVRPAGGRRQRLEAHRVKDEWESSKRIARLVRLPLLRPGPGPAGADHLRDGLAPEPLDR